MKYILSALLTFMVSSSAFAGTEHYLRRDENHVQHLRVTRIGDDIKISMDVEFEPNNSEAGQKACSAEVSGEAKSTGENEITMRKQIEGEAKHCTLKIQTSSNGAKVEQTPECGYYVTGICHFDSDGKELAIIK